MAVLSWANVGNLANILQLLGAVHLLITMAKNFLRLSQNKTECRKLQQRVETLQGLTGWQTPSWSIVQQQQPWLEALVRSTLREADDLVNSYSNATVWSLVRTGRSLAHKFRDLRNRINTYCALVTNINACQFIAQGGPLTAPLLVRVEGKNQGGATPTAAVPSREAEAPIGVDADGVPAHNAAADDGQEAGED